MTKEYIRKCDYCKKEIKNLYDYGVTTLFKEIRIGRGHSFHDYDEKSIRNLMNIETPNDFDAYGLGYSSDDYREFSFCCPEHLALFLQKLYDDTYKSTIKYIKQNKKEKIDDELKRMQEERDKGIFNKIAINWQASFFKKEAKKEIDKMIEDLNKLKKELR